MADTHTAKILLFNVGYCTELQGRLREYYLHFLRYLYTPRRIVEDAFSVLGHLMQVENPDFCCFLEVHPDRRLISHLQQYLFHDFENKYGLRSILRHLPFFRRNCSSIFAHRPVTFQKHFLRYGTKKLLYEIELRNDLSVMITHFSLSRSTRRKQFTELEQLIRSRKRVILCGDFNVFDGEEELRHLLSICNLRIANGTHDFTFPSFHPSKALDLFLCSHDVNVLGVRVLKSIHASDHLPVILEVDLA